MWEGSDGVEEGGRVGRFRGSGGVGVGVANLVNLTFKARMLLPPP